MHEAEILPAFLLWCLHVALHKNRNRPAIIWVSWALFTVGLAVYGAATYVEGLDGTRLAVSLLSASRVGLVGPWLVLCHRAELPFFISLPFSFASAYALIFPMFFLLALFNQVWGM